MKLGIKQVLSALVMSVVIVTGSTICRGAEPAAKPEMAAVIPDTAPGSTLSAWLTAFNSQDDSVLKTYLVRYQPKGSIEEFKSLRDQLAGVELLAVTKSSPKHIEFLASANNGMTIRGKFDVDGDGRPLLTPFVLRRVPAGVAPDDVTLDKALRHKVIDQTLARLDQDYVFPELASKMKISLRQWEARGKYESITDGDEFAMRLTDDLRSVSHDKHLGVYFSPYRVPPDPDEESGWREPSAEERDDMLRRNCDFVRVEVLAENIGYIKFNGFEDPDICGSTVAAAMALVAHVDALIFDLRDNHGGDPQMVQVISSYLFAEPTHLNDLYERKDNKTTQFWTLPYLAGKRIVARPVYVLTSANTFSGGEEFAYDLKNLKRATIIGEQTGGGAHPTAPHQIAEYFSVYVPFARPINPISKSDWEGVGVEPDVRVSALDALTKAQSIAHIELSKSQQPEGSGRRP